MLTAACIALSTPVIGAPMLDPAIDDPEKPWSYFGKTTTLIGVPFMPDAIQVTFDGAIFTGHAELCFFLGDSSHPFCDRQKRWLVVNPKCQKGLSAMYL